MRYPTPADERELREAIVEHGGVHTPLKMQLEDGVPTVIDGTHRFRGAKRTRQTHLPVEYLGPANTWGLGTREKSL
jgi:ParB-like chromosome segregation protein Spo0J